VTKKKETDNRHKKKKGLCGSLRYPDRRGVETGNAIEKKKKMGQDNAEKKKKKNNSSLRIHGDFFSGGTRGTPQKKMVNTGESLATCQRGPRGDARQPRRKKKKGQEKAKCRARGL